MPTTTIKGVDIHYHVQGEGPAVVWGHGLMGSIARQQALSEGIEGLEHRGFRLITFDARGHGESGYTEEESHYSWNALAEDLAGLMGYLGIERAHIGGGSMGAGVAITFALAHPEAVDRLVLIAPPPLGDTIGPARQVFGGFAALIEAAGLEKAVEIAIQMPVFAELKESDPAQYEQLREWLLSQRPRAVVPAIRGLLNGPPLARERFGEIAAPTLIVAHPGDEIHPQASAEELHEAIAGSELIVAPEQGYFQEHQDELIDAVAAFLSGAK